MAVWFVLAHGEYQVWNSCEVGDYANGHIIGIGDTFDDARNDAVDELMADAAQVVAIEEIEEIRGC